MFSFLFFLNQTFTSTPVFTCGDVHQVYLTFYGLEKSGEGKLAIYPKLRPRCLRMVDKKQLGLTKVGCPRWQRPEYIRTHARTHARTHTHMHSRIHARTYTCMHAHTHTHTHTHTVTYIQTHTHTLSLSLSLSLSVSICFCVCYSLCFCLRLCLCLSLSLSLSLALSLSLPLSLPPLFFPPFLPLPLSPDTCTMMFQEEKKEEKVWRGAGEMVNYLAQFLIKRTRDWCEEVEFFLKKVLSSLIQCRSYQVYRLHALSVCLSVCLSVSVSLSLWCSLGVRARTSASLA